MKTKKWIATLALILAISLPMAGLALDDFGAAAVKEGETYTIAQMLTYAIQDEYLARAEYEAIIAKFGVDRPFSNIMKAEITHAEHLLPLFAAHSIAVPEDTAAGHVVLPDTLEEIYQIGIRAEIHNIGMYEAFLAQVDLPEDVKDVFEALKKASQNHLAAFQRNADKPGDGQAARNGSRLADDTANGTYGNRNQSGDMANEGTHHGNGRGRWGN